MKNRAALLILPFLALLTAPARADQTVTGRLVDKGPLHVLELWGTPEEQGYAQGYLVGDRIVRLLDNFVLELVQPQIYETVIVPTAATRFDWSPEAQAEMRGIFRGAQDRFKGKPVRSEKLNRELKYEDLLVANTIADLNGFLCSSFCVWDKLTADGKTLTGRNLDFPTAGDMEKDQLVVVRHGDSKHRGTIGVCWPGLIGIYTAMNDAGVTAAMHDAPGLPASETEGYTARSLTLRQALDVANGENFVSEFTRILRDRRSMIGNNIMATGPVTGSGAPAALSSGVNSSASGAKAAGPNAGEPASGSNAAAPRPPAVVFEYDGNEREHGATPRLPEATEPKLSTCLICTNHYRSRLEPRKCRRYARMDEALTQADQSGTKFDVTSAMKLLRDVAQNPDHGLMTLHSVVFLPNEKRMYVMIPSISSEVVEFRLDEWLSRIPGK